MDHFYYFWISSYILTTAIIIWLFVSLIRKFFTSSSRLDGKHLLITGGSSGIGKCMAIEAAKRGADVTIIARDRVKLDAAANDVRRACMKSSQKVNYIPLDISTNYENVEKVLNNAEQDLGPVFMLINCAGTCICGTFENMSIEDIHYLINLNYLGTIHVIKALITKMKSRREGYIVITASQAALLGIFGYSIYSGTKFALRGIAESLYMEVKPYGIHVTLALPPDTDTPGFANEEKSKPLETKLISESGGLYSPEEVAAQIMNETLRKKFFATVGLESHFISILCSGLSPVSSFLEIVYQASVIGVLRIASYFIQAHFSSIIRKCMRNREKKKKSE